MATLGFNDDKAKELAKSVSSNFRLFRPWLKMILDNIFVIQKTRLGNL